MALHEQVVGLGAASTATLVLGPQHPSSHGVLQLHLVVDGDVVVSAEPEVGFLHRGAEKLFEVRDYRQLVMLANRHDWLSAFSNELGIVLAVERMLGMQLPDRAVWLRTLLAEVNRVLNSLLFLGASLADGPALLGFAEREALQAVMEEATGGRMHYMFNRVGGLKEDVPLGWTSRLAQALDGVRPVAAAMEGLVRDGDLGRGVGVLPAADVLSHGVSGPVARASGVELDLRRDEPYLAYGSLDVQVVTRTEGDAHARFACVTEQLDVSLDLADACLGRLPAGPVALRLPKTVRAPEGTTYAWTEGPLGLSGYYLVSRGDRVPWRLAMRTASFANVSALPVALAGVRVRDLVTVLSSFFFVIGDIDK
ncbi:MAG: NADH-quinone oxidoreductase subunit NuoD [Frankiales bacterium]|jgi:NADH-quinone oxidoreductase subunit D|nr:NADH-quinone oxidoreductase subunit NuoD [Frankiales bacterium]